MKNYDLLDFFKFICCILIVILHTNPFPRFASIILPVTHIAVPFFMVTSAFLLHKKILTCETTKEKKRSLKKYIFANLNLYFIIFLITIPATYYTFFIGNPAFTKGILYGFLYFIRELIFHSTWRSSWFLMTMIIDVAIVYSLKWKNKHSLDTALIVLSVMAYFFCTLGSAYSYIMYISSSIGHSYDIYRKIFTAPYTSLPVGLIYILMGQYIATNEDKICSFLKRNLVYLSISMVALFLEGQLVYRKGLCVLSDDCYFSLIPVTFFLIAICIRYSNIKLPHSIEFRETSKITYCLQGPIIQAIGSGGGVNCILVLISCFSASFFYLNKKFFH